MDEQPTVTVQLTREQARQAAIVLSQRMGETLVVDGMTDELWGAFVALVEVADSDPP